MAEVAELRKRVTDPAKGHALFYPAAVFDEPGVAIVKDPVEALEFKDRQVEGRVGMAGYFPDTVETIKEIILELNGCFRLVFVFKFEAIQVPLELVVFGKPVEFRLKSLVLLVDSFRSRYHFRYVFTGNSNALVVNKKEGGTAW